MILYHLDRLNTFPSDPKDQIIYPINTSNLTEADAMFELLYPKGISQTGVRYLNTFALDNTVETSENLRIYTIEYVFEMVRLTYYPQLPSRFTSLFACQTKEDILKWYSILKPNKTNMENATVKVIEALGATFTADSSWRDTRLETKRNDESFFDSFNPFAYHIWAKKYWSGERNSKCCLETLCELPVRVLDSIPMSDFFSR